VRRLLLLPALASALVVTAALFQSWFQATDAAAALYARKGLEVEPTAWAASAPHAAAILVMALIVAVAGVYAWQGHFIAWIAGAGAAVTGGLLAGVLQRTPPDPGAGTYLSPDQAYDSTIAPPGTMWWFVVAALSLTAWAMLSRPTA
jgi:hypothetical protein